LDYCYILEIQKEYLNDNLSKASEMSENSSIQTTITEPDSPQKSRCNENFLPPTFRYTASPQPQRYQNMMTNSMAMHAPKIPFFNPSVPPPSLNNSSIYGNQVLQDFQLDPKCKPFSMNANVNMYNNHSSFHKPFAQVKPALHTVQSDRPESQVKETGAVMKEEFEKIMKNDVRMVGGESENNCKSNKNNEENENKNYFSNQFQRKSQEYERLKREHIDKELQKIQNKFKEEKGFKSNNEKSASLFEAPKPTRPFPHYQNLPVPCANSYGGFQNARTISQQSQMNFHQRVGKPFKSPFVDEVEKFMSLLFPTTYKELINAINIELRNHCDGSQLELIEFEAYKYITLVIKNTPTTKNAPGALFPKKYVQVKNYRPFEPLKILQLLCSKEVTTHKEHVHLKDCADVLLSVVDDHGTGEMRKGTLIFAAYE